MNEFIICNDEVCEGDGAVDLLQEASIMLNRIAAGDLATPIPAAKEFLEQHNLLNKEYYNRVSASLG